MADSKTDATATNGGRKAGGRAVVLKNFVGRQGVEVYRTIDLNEVCDTRVDDRIRVYLLEAREFRSLHEEVRDRVHWEVIDIPGHGQRRCIRVLEAVYATCVEQVGG